MDIARMAASLRRRRAPEAADLGTAMLRRWWRPVFWPWVFVVSLSFVLVLAVLPFWWAWPILWWLKPLWGRVPLFVLSRALFGATPGFVDTLRGTAAAWRQHGLISLTWRRLTPWRTVTMPVSDLEGLRGGRYGLRSSILAGEGVGGYGFLVSVLCLALFAVFASTTSVVLQFEASADASSLPWRPPETVGEQVLQGVCWFVALTLTEPVYVAAGFGLYLKRRNDLEGWDVELSFRRLRSRIEEESGGQSAEQVSEPSAEQVAKPGRRAAGPTVGLLVVCLSAFAFADPLAGQTPQDPNLVLDRHRQDPEDAINEVFAKIARQTTETSRRWIGDLEDDSDEYRPAGQVRSMRGSPLAGCMRVLLLLLLVAAVVALIVLAIRFRSPAAPRQHRQAPPQEMFGLDLRQDSLPEDLPTAAWQLWQSGDHAGCLSLLYRGSLSDLLEDGVAIEVSSTERDCVDLAQKHAANKAPFFAELTGHWQALAYAHRLPDTATARSLCDGYAACFVRSVPAGGTSPKADSEAAS